MRQSKFITHLFSVFLLAFSVFITACSTDSTNEDDTVTSITTTDEDGSTSVDEEVLTEALSNLALDDLSAAETDGLVFMREEEKLARDVYIRLFNVWNKQVFSSISNSEQTHTDAMLQLLNRYGIADPVGSNPEGVFVNPVLQGLYDSLTAKGALSVIDAFYVGAEIEEIDLIDIQNLVDELDGNEDIRIVYENLMKGSRNHLRGFVSNLEKEGVSYIPQHLPQDEYDAIVNADIETN